MSPVNSMFVCIIKIYLFFFCKKKIKKFYRQMFWKWPISIIGKMLNIGADNRSTPNCDKMWDVYIFHHFLTNHSLKLAGNSSLKPSLFFYIYIYIYIYFFFLNDHKLTVRSASIQSTFNFLNNLFKFNVCLMSQDRKNVSTFIRLWL